MKLNFYEAWNWFATAKPNGVTFKEWRNGREGTMEIDGEIEGDGMYDVPECDSNKEFVAWANDRKNPDRDFFQPSGKEK